MSDHHFWLSEAQFARLKPLLPNKPRGVAREDDRRKRCADHTYAACFHGKRSSIWLCLWPLTMAESVAAR
jgi:hypothetical protein